MLRIGEFSKLAKATVKTLRHYDEIGLLKPIFVDDNGYRYYEIGQLNDLLKIVELRKLDMSIPDIKRTLETKDFRTALKEQQVRLEKELEVKRQQISLIKKYVAKAEKGDFMENYTAKEIVVPANTVYYRHGVIDSMADILQFVLGAGEECGKNNPSLKCKGYCYITYTAKEYKERDIELEYAEAVEEAGTASENIGFREDKEITAISVLHKGKHENLSKAYAYALNTVKEKGYEIDGPIREVYIHGCWDRDDEDDYLTEIQIPIKK